jgi:hypothetical protein
MPLAVLQRRLDDPRETLGPIVAATGDQPHTIAVALQPERIAILLDLVQPIEAGRDAGGLGRKADRFKQEPKNRWLVDKLRTIAAD